MQDREHLLERLTESRLKATNWLLANVDSDGRPAGSERGNGWARLAWALSIAGETAAAAATLDWAVKEGIDADGNFRAGPARGSGLVGGYLLGQLAMGALHVERFDVARLVLDRLEAMQDAHGGIPIDLPGGALDHISDLCSTAQAGIAAILGGRWSLAKSAYAWTIEALRLQPELPAVLYAGRSGEALVLAPPPQMDFLLKVDFRQPRQAYYYPGIAAAFLGAYAMHSGEQGALDAAHRFLALNDGGVAEQFTDQESSQICKYGWGLAIAQIADRSVDYRDQLGRMGEWFIERQLEDGSWLPSSFLFPQPTEVDAMAKTAEHSMEVTALIAALSVVSD